MDMSPDTLETVGFNDLFFAVTVDVSFTTEQVVLGHIDEIHILIVVRSTPIVGYLSPSQICDDGALLRATKLDMEMSPDTLETNLDMEMSPDTLEDFLTKTSLRVSVPRCAPTSSLPFSICPSHPSVFFLSKICFCKELATNTGESSMSASPSLQTSCSDECVFVGLGDRFQHSSFCDFRILVI
jgi:hypothetical protein